MRQHLAATPATPSLVAGRVLHQRRRPRRHRIDHRHTPWLVDLTESEGMPGLPAVLNRVVTFRAQDHLDRGRLGGGIRGDVVRLLHARGIEVTEEDRVLMLAQPRVLGHVFNPLTVHWVVTPGDHVRAAVLEVHNTYGERHAYVLRLDESGRADVGKAFYVSPFYEVGGSYRLRFRLDAQRVAVTVEWRAGDSVDPTQECDVADFVASFSGRPTPARPAQVARELLRRPLMPQRVSTLIRVHGVWLWLRRLPVVPRQPRRPDGPRPPTPARQPPAQHQPDFERRAPA